MQPPTPAAEPERVPRPPPGPVPTPTAHPTDGPPLQVAAAAHRVGVAPSTLRTWDRRYGIGPTDHTPGRHRRYSPDDLARLDLMHRALILGATPADAAAHALAALPAPTPTPHGRHRPPPGATPAQEPAGTRPRDARRQRTGGERARAGGTALRLPGAGWRARGLGRAALALDADTVRCVLVDAIAVIGVQATWNDVTRPVLAAVAQRWVDTGAGIEIEHLLSDCVTGVFSAVAATAAPSGTARPVLLAGMAGDQHRLPLVVLSATLAQRGVSCRSLGADLPPTALTTAIRRTAPAAVLLWSQLSSTADPQVLRSLPRTRPGYRGFVAGPGWAEVDAPAAGRTARVAGGGHRHAQRRRDGVAPPDTERGRHTGRNLCAGPVRTGERCSAREDRHALAGVLRDALGLVRDLGADRRRPRGDVVAELAGLLDDLVEEARGLLLPARRACARRAWPAGRPAWPRASAAPAACLSAGFCSSAPASRRSSAAPRPLVGTGRAFDASSTGRRQRAAELPVARAARSTLGARFDTSADRSDAVGALGRRRRLLRRPPRRVARRRRGSPDRSDAFVRQPRAGFDARELAAAAGSSPAAPAARPATVPGRLVRGTGERPDTSSAAPLTLPDSAGDPETP